MGQISPSEDSRSIASMLVDSAVPRHRIGAGAQGVVYRLDSDDPFFEQFLLKRDRWMWDLPGQDERSFARRLQRHTPLHPCASGLNRNFGQAVMQDEEGNFSLLRNQDSLPLDLWIDRELVERNPRILPSAEEAYQDYLRWLARDVGDEALRDLAGQLQELREGGTHTPDHSKKNNFFWSESRQRFALIDLCDHHHLSDLLKKGRRMGTLLRPIEIAYGWAQGIPGADLATETFKALTYDAGHRFHASGWPWAPKDQRGETQRLEEALRVRIGRIVDHAHFPKEKPSPLIDASSIEDIRVAPVSLLKTRLSDALQAERRTAAAASAGAAR